MKKPIEVQSSSNGWRERTFELSGDLTATIQYEVEEVGRERIRINGRVALDTTGDVMALKRRCLQFRIPVLGGLGIPALLDIRDGRAFGLVALRLTVDGVVLYQDRAFARLDRQLRVRRLPLPARRPEADHRTLPLPGETGTETPEVTG